MYSALNVNMIYLIYAWPNELEKREFAIRSLGNIKWFKHTFNKIRTTIYISKFEFFGNWQPTIWIEYFMKIWICKKIWRIFYKSLYVIVFNQFLLIKYLIFNYIKILDLINTFKHFAWLHLVSWITMWNPICFTEIKIFMYKTGCHNQESYFTLTHFSEDFFKFFDTW